MKANSGPQPTPASLWPVVVILAVTALLGLLTPANPADAQTAQSQSWPRQWTNPTTGHTGGTIRITTIFGALGTNCANHLPAYHERYIDAQESPQLAYLANHAHLALDIDMSPGASVHPIAVGRVLDLGVDNVIVQHATIDGTPFVVDYRHVRPTVRHNQWVHPGRETIGTIVTAGTGSHLHLGIRPGTSSALVATVDARIPGSTNCTYQGRTSGMVDPLSYLSPRQSPGGTISIQSTANSQYVGAELSFTGGDNGMLRARRNGVLAWEQFTIHGDCRSTHGCAIRSVGNGRYVSAELSYGGNKYGMLRARANAILDWERFRIEGDCAVQCSIRSVANGQYVSAELADGGNTYAMLRARASRALAWEMFRTRPA